LPQVPQSSEALDLDEVLVQPFRFTVDRHVSVYLSTLPSKVNVRPIKSPLRSQRLDAVPLPVPTPENPPTSTVKTPPAKAPNCMVRRLPWSSSTDLPNVLSGASNDLVPSSHPNDGSTLNQLPPWPDGIISGAQSASQTWPVWGVTVKPLDEDTHDPRGANDLRDDATPLAACFPHVWRKWTVASRSVSRDRSRDPQWEGCPSDLT
jgi:hypothetical protein